MADISQPRPFRINIPENEVNRMKHLIELSRLPEHDLLPGASWDYGVDLAWLRGMKDEWLAGFDWRSVEEELNQWPQFQVDIEGVTIHYIHAKSSDPTAIPLILSHGWPGSVYEFHKVIGPLVNPPEGEQAFHLVVPSLPGYGFSSAPPWKGWTLNDTARCFDHLMSGVLEYPSYAAQGGDWGSFVTTHLGTPTYPSCKAIHLNMRAVQPPVSALLSGALAYLLPARIQSSFVSWLYSPTDLDVLQRLKYYALHQNGYFAEHATRPFTIGLAIQDSPIGLLAWIGEKFREWSDPDVFPTSALRRDIIATVSLYFLTATFATSTLPYKENVSVAWKPPVRITKPFGFSHFRHDILVMPRTWVERGGNLVWRNQHERGGHFVALDYPEGLVHDVRAFFVSQKLLFE